MLILASQSPARKALLAGAGLAFSVEPAAVSERELDKQIGASDGAVVAHHLAQAKALAVSAHRPHDWVIGADQTLALDDVLLHKPADRAQAARQLDQLCGRTHQLHAGVALAQAGHIVWSGVETAHLRMRRFSAQERDAVLRLEGEAILACVGAYRLEGPSIRLFEQIEGDYFTILGLPLLPLLSALRRFAPQTLEAKP
jgi:septum formation protein